MTQVRNVTDTELVKQLRDVRERYEDAEAKVKQIKKTEARRSCRTRPEPLFEDDDPDA